MVSTDKEKLIFQKLKEQKERLENDGFRVAYICVYGSQNYGLDLYTEDYQSDIDMKAVIIPTLDDLVYNCKPVSKKYTYDSGEIDLKDIRVYIDTLVKANPAYIETLFTKYYIIDPEFEKEMQSILNLKDELVHTLRYQFIRAIYGMMMEKKNAMCHPYPTIAHKIEKYGFDGKQTSHCIRLYCMMNDYFVENKSLSKCFYPPMDKRYIILEHKLNNISLDEAIKEVDSYMELAEEIKTKVLDGVDQNTLDYSVKSKVINLSREIIKSNIISMIKTGG